MKTIRKLMGPALIVGIAAMSSTTSMGAEKSARADQQDVVRFNIAAQSPAVSGIGKSVFHALRLSNVDIGVTAEYADEELGLKKLGVMYVNNDTGKLTQAEFVDTFKAAAAAANGIVCLTTYFDPKGGSKRVKMFVAEYMEKHGSSSLQVCSRADSNRYSRRASRFCEIRS